MSHTRHVDPLQDEQIAVAWVPKDQDHQKLRLSRGVLCYIADARKICLHDGVTFGGIMCWNGNLTPQAETRIKGIAPIQVVRDPNTGEWVVDLNLCSVPTAPIGTNEVIFCQSGSLRKGALPVVQVNSPPIAVDDSYQVQRNTLLTGVVAANDSDADGDTLVYTMVTPPAHGTASLAATGSFTYVPASGYVGPDTFVYSVSDGNGGTDTATVSIDVFLPNQPPVAVNDTFTTPYQTSFSGTVATNDSDPEGGALTFAVTTQPASGTVVMQANGSFIYTPAAGFSGQITFTYTVTDAQGLTATAVVTGTVGPNAGTLVATNDGPVRFRGYAAGASNSLLLPTIVSPLGNDVDSLGRAFNITNAVVNTGNGTVTFTGTQVTFTPTSNAMENVDITYTITNTAGQTATAHITGLLGQAHYNSFGNIIVFFEYSDGVLTDVNGNIVTI